MIKILGFGGVEHDFATCAIIGKKIYAIEDERLIRKRYAVNSNEPCIPSLKYCLEWTGMSIENYDSIIVTQEAPRTINRKLYPNLIEIDHHISHSYSTFFTSKFDEAAILVVDGAGSKKSPDGHDGRDTTTYAYGKKNKVSIIGKVFGYREAFGKMNNNERFLWSNSLGEYYRAIAESIDLGWLSGPGKAMGMSSYAASMGDDYFVPIIMENIKLLENGKFIIQLNGANGLINRLKYERVKKAASESNSFKIDSSIAYSGQIVFEKLLFHALRHLKNITNTNNLCLAGGVALNSLANGKITAETGFKNVHVFFAPGDNGTAIGAALWGYINQQNKNSKSSSSIRFKHNPFLGRLYSDKDIEKALSNCKLKYNKSNNLHTEVAKLLASGKTVAWYQGGSEFGPRALGNRSILADPRKKDMRDHINDKIKNREWYRPLAAVVIKKFAAEYFEPIGPYNESDCMQFVWKVKDCFKKILPAITHIDGSARIQTIDKHQNELFFNLIDKFKSITGIPVLLNTSFNIQGEPINETPVDAIRSFQNSAIDALVMSRYILLKN